MIFREFDRDDICGICELINCELGYSVSVDDLALRIKQCYMTDIIAYL